MLKIRLARVGRRNRPLFRVVVTPHTAPAKSGYLAVVGNYNPANKKLEVDREAIKKWLKSGAQLSTTVNNLFVKEKIIKGEITKVSRKKKVKKEKKQEKEKKPKKKEVKAKKKVEAKKKEPTKKKKVKPKTKKKP